MHAGQEYSSVSEAYSCIVHFSQMLPYLNLLNVLRSWWSEVIFKEVIIHRGSVRQGSGRLIKELNISPLIIMHCTRDLSCSWHDCDGEHI